MNELQTIQQVLAGDDEAYGRLIERYQTGLVRYCYTLVGDADGAEDIAQEAFIKAYSSLDRYNADYKFGTWLYRIARNLALSKLRRRESLPLTDDQEIADEDVFADAMATEEREAAVRAAVQKLPERYRSIIHLHYWERQSYEEIAELMELPVSTIKTWLFRARQQLKKECHEIVR